MAKSYELGIIISATDRATKVLSRVSSRLRLIESATSRASAKMAAIGAKATAAAAGMGYAFSRPIKSAMDFESAMADVKKVVNFDGAADFKNFGNEIVRMSTRIPIAADGLAQIAAAGGQLGIAKKDLMGFAETVAKMSTAFDMLPDEAGDAIAKMMNVYSLNLDQVTRLGDAINYLSDNTAAKSRDIVNYLKRVGGMAKTFGMSATSAAALGDALLGLGTPVEVAARGTNQILRRLMTADHQGKKFQKGLKRMGLSARKVMRMVKKDADGTILWLLERLKGMDPQEMMGVISDMFGAEWAPMVANLVQHIDQYKEAMRMAGDKTLYAGSMQREFANRAATTANKLQLLRSSFTAIGINLGSVFLPKVQKTVDKIRVVTDRLGEWAAANPELSEKMGEATVKIIAITAAIGGVSLVIAGVVKAVGLLFSPVRLAVGVLGTLGKAFVSVAKVAAIKGSVSIEGIGAAIRAVGVLGGAVLAVGSAFVWLNNQIAKAGKQEIDDKRVMGKSLEALKAQRQRVAAKLEKMRHDRGFLGTGLGAPDRHKIAAQEARLKRLDSWIGKIERGEVKAPSNEPKMPDYMRKLDEMMGRFREYQDHAMNFYRVISGEKATTRSIARMGMAGAGSVMIAVATPVQVAQTATQVAPQPKVVETKQDDSRFAQELEAFRAREEAQRAQWQMAQQQIGTLAEGYRAMAARPPEQHYNINITVSGVVDPHAAADAVVARIKSETANRQTRSLRDEK